MRKHHERDHNSCAQTHDTNEDPEAISEVSVKRETPIGPVGGPEYGSGVDRFSGGAFPKVEAKEQLKDVSPAREESRIVKEASIYLVAVRVSLGGLQAALMVSAVAWVKKDQPVDASSE